MRRPTRRRVLAAVGGMTGMAGCTSQESIPGQIGNTPTPASPTVTEQPEALLADPEQLPTAPGTTLNRTGSKQVQSGIAVNYEIDDGDRPRQITVQVTRRQTVDGAVFDHDKLVDYYSQKHETTVEELSFGHVGSLVTFETQSNGVVTTEVHAIVTHRNVHIHVTSYRGHSDQVVAIARAQLENVKRQTS